MTNDVRLWANNLKQTYIYRHDLSEYSVVNTVYAARYNEFQNTTMHVPMSSAEWGSASLIHVQDQKVQECDKERFCTNYLVSFIFSFVCNRWPILSHAVFATPVLGGHTNCCGVCTWATENLFPSCCLIWIIDIKLMGNKLIIYSPFNNYQIKNLLANIL